MRRRDRTRNRGRPSELEEDSAPLARLGVEEAVGTIEAAAGDARERFQALALCAARREVGLDGSLGEPPERNVLAAGADRGRKRPQVVRD